MNIHSLNLYKQTSFKGATININAFSDTHGELFLANNALEEMRMRKTDIFCPQERGNANITAICGDWFMDGARKGYLSNPEKENAKFQLDIFNAFMSQIKKMAPDNITLFTLGNHEFDGGVKLLAEILDKIDAEIIMTNLNAEDSPAFKKITDSNKLVSQKIIEVDDDKIDGQVHKIMFLGVSPVNLISYQKNLNGISLKNNVNKSQVLVTADEYAETFDFCQNTIKEFKEKNPKGFVVLMSHTGVEFADNLARHSKVDLILDGHEHKDETRVVNGVPIVPLSQNFKKLVNAKLKINDNGNLDSIRIKSYSPLDNPVRGPLHKLYKCIFEQDIKKIYTISPNGAKIKSLETTGIRTGNNYLANFVTDSVLSELKKGIHNIDFFALNSSAIRHSLKLSDEASISQFDVLNVLSGIKEEDGQIMLTEVTGEELAYLVVDNILFNQKNPNRNPLIQYSGLTIDRTKILEALSRGESLKNITRYITDENTGNAINESKMYTIANVEKYFDKSDNPQIRELKEHSEYFGMTVQEALKNHFISTDEPLYAKFDTRIK